MSGPASANMGIPWYSSASLAGIACTQILYSNSQDWPLPVSNVSDTGLVTSPTDVLYRDKCRIAGHIIPCAMQRYWQSCVLPFFHSRWSNEDLCVRDLHAWHLPRPAHCKLKVKRILIEDCLFSFIESGKSLHSPVWQSPIQGSSTYRADRLPLFHLQTLWGQRLRFSLRNYSPQYRSRNARHPLCSMPCTRAASLPTTFTHMFNNLWILTWLWWWSLPC